MRIVARGMVCAGGLNAATACAAIHAGIAGFSELPYRDNDGEPIIGAMVPGLDPNMKRGERLTQLLSTALADCLKQAHNLRLEGIPLLVGLPEPGRPGPPSDLPNTILPGLRRQTGLTFSARFSQTIPKGHVAGFEGLRIARQLLADSSVTACLVCGVDSYINASSLKWLDRHNRLKTERNSNGVIPGEAASAVLVQAVAPDSRASADVSGIGFATEPVHILSEKPFLGLGLAEATRRALADAALALHEVDFRLSDVTGESYGFKEQALMLSRVMRDRRTVFPIWHSADAIGDTGAAAGICHLIRVVEAFAKNYAPGNRAIAFASNVLGERAAVILQRHGINSSSMTIQEIQGEAGHEQ